MERIGERAGENVSFWERTAQKLYTRPLTESLTTDVCVIGAGIAGVTTAYLLAKQGNKKAALEQFDFLRKAASTKKIAYVSGYHEALIHVGLGDNQRALDSLEEAQKQKGPPKARRSSRDGRLPSRRVVDDQDAAHFNDPTRSDPSRNR